jgi:hypothetical protein
VKKVLLQPSSAVMVVMLEFSSLASSLLLCIHQLDGMSVRELESDHKCLYICECCVAIQYQRIMHILQSF